MIINGATYQSDLVVVVAKRGGGLDRAQARIRVILKDKLHKSKQSRRRLLDHNTILQYHCDSSQVGYVKVSLDLSQQLFVGIH